MSKLNLEVPKLPLNDGASIPMLGFGTGTALYKKVNDGKIDRPTVDQVKTAISVGYRHLDSSEAYGTEAEVGLAIKESKVPRSEFFITTKVNQTMDDIPSAIDQSLKRLQVDHVDLFLIHKPDFAGGDPVKLQQAWAAMEEVKASGKAKSIGVSNYSREQLEATLQTAKVIPVINQIEFHAYHQRDGLVQWAREQGIATTAYAPLIPITKASPGPVDAILPGLAKKYAVNEGEILLRWVLENKCVALTTSSKEQRLSDMLRICTFDLTPKEVEDLSQAGLQKKFVGFT